jgi:hypothetical protein
MSTVRLTLATCSLISDVCGFWSGTQKANAIMTAVDQAGNKAARYRDVSTSVEIIVHPSWKLNDELALALVISAGWLEEYFGSTGGGL